MINCNFVNYEEQLFHVIRTRTTTFEDYKDILIGYNESESKWEQKYVDLLLHMEFDSDVYFDFGSTLQNLPYRL